MGDLDFLLIHSVGSGGSVVPEWVPQIGEEALKVVRRSSSVSWCFCQRYGFHFLTPETAYHQTESRLPWKLVAFALGKAVVVGGEPGQGRESERRHCGNNLFHHDSSLFPLPFLEVASQASIYSGKSHAPSLFDADESDVRRWHCAFVSRQQLWKQPARQQVPVWDHSPCQGSSFDTCSPLS